MEAWRESIATVITANANMDMDKMVTEKAARATSDHGEEEALLPRLIQNKHSSLVNRVSAIVLIG